MREPIRYLGEHSTLPISCIPNAGLPLNVDGQAVYPLEPQPFADTLAEFVSKYPRQRGGRLLRHHPGAPAACWCRALRGNPGQPAPAAQLRRAWPQPSRLSPCCRSRAPFLIGERLNTQGSAKFKKMILAEDFDGALEHCAPAGR